MSNWKSRRGRSFAASVLLALAVLVSATVPSVGATSSGRAADAADSSAALKSDPKVVIVVGPTGSLTNSLRAEANAAARAARRFTDNVITLYTPHATWAAVRPALQGASVVVYMGHGNGWPSKYRNSLYRPTQNGLGLNPVAGGNDHTHKYYGERFLARDVRLAPGAIVLLHHLCYAAGNSEPGLPEGPHHVAKQRVDNYAAGWFAAGASAVVAEAYFAPSYYVRSVLGTNRDIEAIWRASPSFKGNVEAYPSKRTPNAVAFIDPDLRRGKYGRSLVVRDGEDRFKPGRGKRGDGEEADTPTADEDVDGDGLEGELLDEPALLDVPPPLAGVRLRSALVEGLSVVGSPLELSWRYKLRGDGSLPAGMMASAQWQPVELNGDPAPLQELVAEKVAALAVAEAGPDEGEVEEGAGPQEATPDDADDAADDDATEEAEATLELETAAPAEPFALTVGRRKLRMSLETPEDPGLYQLLVTLHDADGGVLDEDGLPAMRELLVYVAPPLSASYETPEELETAVGESLALPLTLANNGTMLWQEAEADAVAEHGPDPLDVIPPEQARLVAHLVKLGGEETEVTLPEEPLTSVEVPVLPGESAELQLQLGAPGTAGEYLLVLDVVTPSHGSLAASGVAPAFVTLRVGPLPLPEPGSPVF